MSRQKDIHPRPELHQSEPLPGSNLVAWPDAADQSPGQHADHLAENGRLTVVVDPHVIPFVLRRGLPPIRGQESAWRVLHFQHAARDGNAVDVDI